MKVSYSKNFLKQYSKLNPNMQIKVDKKILLWQSNPINPLLKNHSLLGKLAHYRSINISGDYRALYIQHDNEVIFDAVGTHSQLYG